MSNALCSDPEHSIPKSCLNEGGSYSLVFFPFWKGVQREKVECKTKPSHGEGKKVLVVGTRFGF